MPVPVVTAVAKAGSLKVHRTAERMPVMDAFEAIYRAFPMVRRMAYRAWYHRLARFAREGEVVHTNYGYAPLDGDSGPDLHEQDEPHRFGIQLYHHVATLADIAGRDVLEVGCGRGGGASYISRYLGTRTMTGVDLDAQAVEFCRRNHRAPGLGFRRGNSEALPFRAGSFDAVVNVESSHCYGSMHRFLCEVKRVLRPGGRLLMADFRSRPRLRTLRRQISHSGFTVEGETSITANVFRALEADSERKLDLIRRRVPAPLRSVFNQFAATEGTPTYEAFRTGAWDYRSFRLAPNGS